MKKLLSTLLALSLALSLGACAVKVSPDAPGEPKPDEPTTDELQIVFSEDRLTKQTEYKADDGTVLLIEKYDLPLLEVRTAAGEVYAPPSAGNAAADIPPEYRTALAFNAEMQRAADLLDASSAEDLETARDHYASLDAEQRAYWVNYAEELTADSSYRHSGLLSVWGTGYFNLGGAHGWAHTRTWNFDLTGGSFLTLDDLDVQSSTDGALGETLTHTLAMAILEQIDAQGLGEYYFEDHASYIFDLSVNANFYFDETGMTVVFDSSVIAPYAAGPQEFKIPYSRFYNALGSRTQSLLDVPQDEIIMADYYTTKLLWSWFNMTTPPVDNGAPGITADGQELARVTLGGVNTLDGLRTLLCEHVSAELADEWLATGRFVESNGALYAAWADRGSDITIMGDELEVTITGSGGVLTQRITRGSWSDDAQTFVPTGAEDTYEYPFTLVDGHAVFSAFPCPY